MPDFEGPDGQKAYGVHRFQGYGINEGWREIPSPPVLSPAPPKPQTTLPPFTPPPSYTSPAYTPTPGYGYATGPLLSKQSNRALIRGFLAGFSVLFVPHAVLHPRSYLNGLTPLFSYALQLGFSCALLFFTISLIERKRLGAGIFMAFATWGAAKFLGIAWLLGAVVRF